MSGVNWQRDFSHYSISGSVAPSSMQKLWTPLSTISIEKKIEKDFGVVLDPFKLHHEKNFWFLEKYAILKFSKQMPNPEPVIHE